MIGHPITGVSEHGFVTQLPRGPQRSRYHVQCSLADQLPDGLDRRLWDEIRLRTGDSSLENLTVLEKKLVPLCSAIHFPIQYGQLFLAGDAAHLVPPTGAKGMNLALFDVDILAQELISALRDQDMASGCLY